MQTLLHGKVALVTGAGHGIGAATAAQLARAGAKVAVVDLDEVVCQQVVSRLEHLGGMGTALSCDVTKTDQVQQMVSDVISRLGRLDILVNSAGLLRDNPLGKMSDEDWNSVLDVHLKGTFLCVRAAQQHMIDQHYGRIITLSSTAALGNPWQTNYAAACMGIQGLTRSLALELGAYQITVNAVAPGWIDTEMTREIARHMGLTPEAMREEIAKRVPLQRIGEVEDVARLIHFLASDDASYVSGQIIYVAGGPV